MKVLMVDGLRLNVTRTLLRSLGIKKEGQPVPDFFSIGDKHYRVLHEYERQQIGHDETIPVVELVEKHFRPGDATPVDDIKKVDIDWVVKETSNMFEHLRKCNDALGSHVEIINKECRESINNLAEETSRIVNDLRGQVNADYTSVEVSMRQAFSDIHSLSERLLTVEAGGNHQSMALRGRVKSLENNVDSIYSLIKKIKEVL